MKRIILTSIITILAISNIAYAQSIKAYLAYSRFYSEETGPYLETYLTVLGNTMKAKDVADGKQQLEANITLVFRQGDEIKFIDKYTLQSPEFIDDKKNMAPNLVDQQRIPLANGKYDFEIILSDNNNPGKEFKSSQEVEIGFSNLGLQVSDIQLIEDYQPTTSPNILSKSGFDLVPFSNNYYPTPTDKIKFYAEVYNCKAIFKDEPFVIKTFIENDDNKQVAANLSRFAKQKPEQVNVVLSEFPLEKLPTGNYNLVLEVRDKENNLVADQRIFFQRSSDDVGYTLDDLASIITAGSFVENFKTPEILADHIKSTWPISTKMEKIYAKNQLNLGDLEMMKKYFYNFWQKRNALNPEEAWNAYYKEVQKVDNEFKTSISKGYETDRGRIYLQFGPPNVISKRYNEPSSLPYEIWHYYQIDASLVNPPQSDKRFVFANVNSASNDFELIHSDAYGETRNNRWQIQLQNRTDQFYNLDTEDGIDHYGGRSQDLFNNPR